MDDTARFGRAADLLTEPLRALAILLLAGFGVWMLAGIPWALITGAGLLLLDAITDPIIERATNGRADRSA